LSVKALNSAPSESKAIAISLQVLFLVPLKSRCSMRWVIPLFELFSLREPACIQNPREIDLKCGRSSLIIFRPFSSLVIS
jgi:hypothetical protein